MLTLWVLCHVALVLCGLLISADDMDMGLYAAAACSLGPTVLVFALVLATASLIGAFSRWVRARTGALVSPVVIAAAYAGGLGTLAASVVFAYRIGFSTSARLAFVAVTVATCGMLTARKRGAV